MADLIFEVAQESDGGFVAACLTEPIVTQGEDWISLREAVADAVKGYFFDAPESMPKAISLQFGAGRKFCPRLSAPHVTATGFVWRRSCAVLVQALGLGNDSSIGQPHHS